MDSADVSDAAFNKLTLQDKVELERFVQNERQKANIQARSHSLTVTCWKKCVPGSITSGTLDKNESACLTNCVDRFMDANMLAFKHLQNLRTS